MISESRTVLSPIWSFFSSFYMCFSNISDKQLVYHWHCTSQLYPSSLNHSDKAEPRCLLPSFLTGHQHSSTDFITGANNQTNQCVMLSTGFLLPRICFRSSPFEHCSFLIHILFAPLFPFSCMFLCRINGRYRTSFKCSLTICQEILSTSV